jgi:hypothetical protein
MSRSTVYCILIVIVKFVLGNRTVKIFDPSSLLSEDHSLA